MHHGAPFTPSARTTRYVPARSCPNSRSCIGSRSSLLCKPLADHGGRVLYPRRGGSRDLFLV